MTNLYVADPEFRRANNRLRLSAGSPGQRRITPLALFALQDLPYVGGSSMPVGLGARAGFGSGSVVRMTA